MPYPEKPIPVPSATLDMSIQYKGEFLNNCRIVLFGPGFDTGEIPLGENGRKCFIVSQSTSDLVLRINRTSQGRQDDASQYPVVGGEFPFGPVTANARVLILVAEPKH